MRLRCGTSGFSYPAWRGGFYPAGARAEDLLGLYAARLPAVEINATFYRMPSARVVAGWREQVPAGFSFVLKGPQVVTHRKRLRQVSQETSHFHAVAAELGPALGPVLWQLPPNLKKDLPRLEAFLALLPGESRPALQLPHESWLADDVHRVLQARGAAVVAVDDGQREPPLVATARFGYLRLRAPDYPPEALRAWAERIRAQPWDEAWVFFGDRSHPARLAAHALEMNGLVAPPAWDRGPAPQP